MTSIFEGQKRPKLPPKQRAPFGFQVPIKVDKWLSYTWAEGRSRLRPHLRLQKFPPIMAYPWLVSQGRKQPPYVEKKNGPGTPNNQWLFGETTISYVKIGNHPIETTIYKWLFGVPGRKILGKLVEIDFDFNRNHPQKIRLDISDPDYLHNVLPTQTTMLGGSSQSVSG